MLERLYGIPQFYKHTVVSDKIRENIEKPNPSEQQNESGETSNQYNKYDDESYINPKFAGAHFNYTNTDFMNPASSYEKPTRVYYIFHSKPVRIKKVHEGHTMLRLQRYV